MTTEFPAPLTPDGLLPLKVINITAAPGVGKSTAAAGLFNVMKTLGDFKVELVTEYAKDLTYEERNVTLANQFYLTAKQDHRLRRLVGKVDWVITDSPLPLSIAYMPEEYKEWLEPAVWGAFERYQNFNVHLLRDPKRPYQTYGRNQSEAESMRLDCVIDHIFSLMEDRDPDYSMETMSGPGAPFKIFERFVDGQ